MYSEAPLKFVGLDSEHEPDIVATSSLVLEDYGQSEPLLVVEVSETSLAYGLNAKAELYADAGVPEYWVVNLVDRELVVFRSPREGAYRDWTAFQPGDQITPETWADVRDRGQRSVSYRSAGLTPL